MLKNRQYEESRGHLKKGEALEPSDIDVVKRIEREIENRLSIEKFLRNAAEYVNDGKLREAVDEIHKARRLKRTLEYDVPEGPLSTTIKELANDVLHKLCDKAAALCQRRQYPQAWGNVYDARKLDPDHPRVSQLTRKIAELEKCPATANISGRWRGTITGAEFDITDKGRNDDGTDIIPLAPRKLPSHILSCTGGYFKRDGAKLSGHIFLMSFLPTSLASSPRGRYPPRSTVPTRS